MNLAEYRQHVEAIPYGKRLPTAHYVFRADGASLGEELDALLTRVAAACGADARHKVLKLRLDELKVSFLSYPDFLDNPHPALRHAITVDLVTGKSRQTDYTDNFNPPILHRKETFLPSDHPRRTEFAALTKTEEAEGLYEHTTAIGFKLNWERLLNSKGLILEGHQVVRQANDASVPNKLAALPTVQRHRTALARYDLSKPVKSVLEYGLLKPPATFFDYGCGQGNDVNGLTILGLAAQGWDPVFRPETAKHSADIVNLGFVLNVIEDPAERLETLCDAYRLTRKLLIVSSMIRETTDQATTSRFRDGVLTSRSTFQKYFEQQELQQYIEDALETTAFPVALGVFYVFREPSEQQDFLSARNRRTLDWTQISARLGLGEPRTLWKTLYEEHKELLDGFGRLALALGRFPEPTEYEQLAAVNLRLGSAKRALRTFVGGSGAEGVNWEEVRVRFGIGQPPKRRWEILYEENRDLLDVFWGVTLQLGRLPEPEEFPRTGELREKIGSPNRALRMFIEKGGGEEIKRAAENRRRDLLVYVALANLRKRVPFGDLSPSLRSDIRAFFGNYTRALEQGLELLYAAGDAGEIELACEELKVGWQDEQALYLHRTLLEELPPVLRAYVGCATALFGDVAQADVIKLHKTSGKVTFLAYDNFEEKPLPELRQRIKVNLRTRWVQVFDHSAEEQLLFYKERFLSAQHPRSSEMKSFSSRLRKLGIPDIVCEGPSKRDFLSVLERNGLNEKLNKRRRFL